MQLLPSNIPYREILMLYAKVLKASADSKLSNRRRRYIRAVWQANKSRRSLEFWRQYFERCEREGLHAISFEHLLYELEKRAWIEANETSQPEEYERAIRSIAQRFGV